MTEEPVNAKRNEKVALQMVPVILEGRNGIRIKANAILDGGSSSSYLREQVADTLGLEAEHRPLRITVFGAKTVVTDSKTVTIHVESMNGDTKTEVLLRTTQSICKMRAMVWSQSREKLCHLRDLRMAKPVGSGEVDLLIGSDYYEELLPLEHCVGRPGEPVGVKTPLGWTIVGHVPEGISGCRTACHTFTFHANPIPELQADELMCKMWDDELAGLGDQKKQLTAEEMYAEHKVANSRRYIGGRYEEENSLG